VATDQHAYNRVSGLRFRCVPETAGFDKWPMGVEELSDGSVVVVALDGVARVFAPDGTLLRQWRVSLNGLCAVDVDAADRLAISSYPVDYPVDARAPSMVNLYSPDGQLQAQCALNSLAHSVQFDQWSVLIGTHTGEFLRWDGDPGDAQAAPTTVVTKPKRGKGK